MFTKSWQLFGVVAAASAVVAIAGCVPAEDKCDATTVQTVQLTATLVATDAARNSYYLATPATARSACDAHYQLTFHWAATPRNTTDATVPPLSNLARAFHVDADSIWWFHEDAVRTTDAPLINWQIDFPDHDAVATSPQSLYYIRTGLATGAAGDSVVVSGKITYYPK